MLPEEDIVKILLELETNGKVIAKKQGASGAVYIIDKGEGHIPQRLAYKTVRVDKISDVKKKHFIEECEIWLNIQSNYIARALYPHIIRDNLFIAMPYYDCSLQSLLEEAVDSKKSISYLDSLVIVCKITKALIELKRFIKLIYAHKNNEYFLNKN